MIRPVVGIIANHSELEGGYVAHTSGLMNSDAISNVAGCMPLLIPSSPKYVSVEELMATCDGFMFTGGRPNVHPKEYGEAETKAHGDFDHCRDNIALPLIRACVDRGQPFFGICRGFQEVNVAMGGTLYPEIRDLEGRMNHRMPVDGTMQEKFAHRHKVSFSKGGVFEQILGDNDVMTNTLHGQGIKDAGPRVVIDGYAEDGTPEATYIKGAPGFTLAVQWHPEYNAGNDSVSRPLFEAFGNAVRDWAQGRTQALKSA